METLVISCLTLEFELKAALERTGLAYPVVWLEAGLHNTPDKLNARLCEEIASAGAQRVLLAMGFCGNSLAGLGSDRAEIIVPRVDDCISLLLGGVRERLKVSSENAAYFLTEGWMRGERNLWVEYQHLVKRYGVEDADRISKMMYGNYRTLALLDTGVSSIDELWKETEIISETLHLQRKVIPATLKRMEELLTGPWSPEKYLIVPPGEKIVSGQMVLEN